MKKGVHPTKAETTHWKLLWHCFEQITAADPPQRTTLLKDIKIKHPELFPEIDHLIQSHQSKTSILDKELIHLGLTHEFRPPKIIGGFDILEPLGSGGLGDVYKGRKQEDGFEHVVAIKFASSGQYSPLVLDSFNNELNILLSLNHPHIERLFEGGVTEDGIPYLVVEYIDGQHIDAYCDHKELTVRQRIQLFLQVCEAVTTMHQSLIIHRDIKASNIMVDGNGIVKLLDFGLAKLAENKAKPEASKSSQLTSSGFMMTLAYASPEQIRGHNITTISDVYSLGMLLYYLLAGQLPYAIDPGDLVATTQQINDLEPLLASQNINPGATITASEPTIKNKLKGELDAILAKAISKQPESRYDSAQQLADDLKCHLKNEPVLAQADTMGYRMRKFIQRHTFGVVTTTGVMLSLMALSVMLFNRSHELARSLQATQAEKQRVSQVTTFLIDVFKLSDPIKNQSDVIEVKDLLDYSSQQLSTQFNQQPDTKAKLYLTLAEVYLNMSDIESAQRLLIQSKLIKREKTPIDHLTATLIEAELLQKKGQLQEAVSLLNAFEKQYRSIELPINLKLKKSLMAGQLLYQLGELDSAIETLQRANQHLLTQEDPNDLFNNEQRIKSEQLQADIFQLLGNIYWKKGDLDQVEVNYQKSFDSNSLRWGLEHHATLKSLSALGVLAYSQGHFELAKSRFEQVLISRIKQLGQNHYLTADAHNRLGATEYELGHLSAAETHYLQALESFAASGLSASIKYTRVLNNLGLIKRQQTQYTEAEQLFQQALKIQTQMLGDQHPDLASMLNNLGLTAYDQGYFKQALEQFQHAYQVQFDANGLNNANIAFSMTNMGRMYLYLKQPGESILWINQALQLRAELLGTNHLLYAATLMVEAEWLVAAKKHDKAAKSIEMALKIREKQLDERDWRLADSRFNWHNLSQQSGATTEQLCADAQIITHRFGAEHPRAQDISIQLQALGLTACVK